MPIVVEKKRRVERTVKLIRPSPSSEVAVYGGRKAQPVEGPNLTRRGLQAWVLGGWEETFRRNWWTSQDLGKGSKIGSSFIFNGMVPGQNLPYRFQNDLE